LSHDEAAERDQAAERRERACGLVVCYIRRQPEIKADDQEEHRDGGGELQQDGHAARQRRTAEQKLVGQAQHDADIGKQRVEIDAGDVAEVFDEHRAWPQLVAGQTLALPRRCDIGLRLHRHQQHDVVVDQNLHGALAQTEPAGGLERFHMVAAPEEPHLAVIVERRLDLDPHGGSPAMRFLDLGVRHLDEIGVRQHGGERSQQVRVGSLERVMVEAGMRLDLGIEVEVVVAQPFELREIFIVIDGGEQAADLAEAVALRLVEAAVVDQGLENVGLANRDEMTPIVGRVSGPAIIQEALCTTLVGPGQQATVGDIGELYIEKQEARS